MDTQERKEDLECPNSRNEECEKIFFQLILTETWPNTVLRKEDLECLT